LRIIYTYRPNVDCEKRESSIFFIRFPPPTLNLVISFSFSRRRQQKKSLYYARFVFNVYNRNVVPAASAAAGLDLLRLTPAGEPVGRSAARKTRWSLGPGAVAFTSGILKTVRFLTHETSIRLSPRQRRAGLLCENKLFFRPPPHRTATRFSPSARRRPCPASPSILTSRIKRESRFSNGPIYIYTHTHTHTPNTPLIPREDDNASYIVPRTCPETTNAHYTREVTSDETPPPPPLIGFTLV